MYDICGEKKTTFHRLSYIFFLFFHDPGHVHDGIRPGLRLY